VARNLADKKKPREAGLPTRTNMVQQGGRAHRFGAQYAQDVTATSIKTTSYPVHRFGTQCAFTVHLTRGSRAFVFV
jgi:hypothetical protein